MSLETIMREFLLSHFLELLQEQETVETKEQPVSAPRIWGQIGGDSTRTGRQGNLRAAPGTGHLTQRANGVSRAVGDTKRHHPSPPEPPRNSPVVPQDFLIQPYMSLSVIQKGIEVQGGKTVSFAGTHPFGYRTIGLEPPLEPLPEGETQPGSVDREQYYPAPAEVQAVWQSRLYRPAAPPLAYEERALLAQHVPQERPYACGFDRYGLYIASWDHWDLWEGFDVVDRGAPAGISFGLMAGQFGFYTQEGQAFEELYPEREKGLAGIAVSEGITPESVYAYRYRFGAAEPIVDAFGAPLSRPVERTTYVPEATGGDNSDELEEYVPSQFDAQGRPINFAVRSRTVSISGGFASAPTGDYRTGYALMAYAFGSISIRNGSYDYNTPPEPLDPSATPPPEYREDATITYGPTAIYYGQPTDFLTGGAVTVDFPPFYDSTGSDPGGQRPEIDFSPPEYFGSYPHTVNEYPPGLNTPSGAYANNTQPSPSMNGVRAKLTDAQRDAAFPFWRGWPDPPTEESRAEVALLNKYIYGEPEGAVGDGEPPPYGRLANPTAELGAESTWAGLSWTTLEYVCDLFYADLPDPVTGEPVTHLWGVAILHDDGVYTVKVSKDETPVGEWPLEALFPLAPKDEPLVLKHLDGTLWPPAEGPTLKPHYTFAHPLWPLRDVGYLAPFRARLKNRFDKKLPPDCPVMLTFDSFANEYDPATPEAEQEFYPRDFDEAVISGISGVTPAQQGQLTAPFDPRKAPKSVATLQNFTVTVDLSDVQLPISYLVRAYVYVVAGMETAPNSYHPLAKPLKSKIWRLAPDLTGAQVVNGNVISVGLDKPYKIARVFAEIRGIKPFPAPLWLSGIIEN